MTPAQPDKLRIKCPSCKSSLSIAKSPGIEQKVLTCPVCKYKATVSSYINASMNIRVQSNDEPTEYGQSRPPIHKGTQPAQLKVNGRSYPLQVGSNTVGRKAATSQARIQIEGDGYMSRMQGVFYVENTPEGYRYRFEELKAPNHTSIRGTVLAEGDVVAINPGDILVMGETSVKLENGIEGEQTMTI